MARKGAVAVSRDSGPCTPSEDLEHVHIHQEIQGAPSPQSVKVSPMREFEVLWPSQRLTCVELIGTGGYGHVFRARDESTGYVHLGMSLVSHFIVSQRLCREGLDAGAPD
jgi:hypothetical protein